MNISGRVVITFIAICTALSLGAKLLTHYADQKVAEQLSPQKLQQMADKINASLPKTVNEDFRLEKVVAKPSEFEYMYTVVSYSAADVDLFEFEKVVKNYLLSLYCNAEQMQPLLQNNIRMTASYHDNRGDVMATVTANQASCNQS
ncbi:hypothetical protein [Motilimonas sp. KMU-193]|uniref:hypothetical protein n=1 Tax=Motilimonas sp. KMU-193 TaxID=3388668 RepID=UPI00396B2048